MNSEKRKTGPLKFSTGTGEANELEAGPSREKGPEVGGENFVDFGNRFLEVGRQVLFFFRNKNAASA